MSDLKRASLEFGQLTAGAIARRHAAVRASAARKSTSAPDLGIEDSQPRPTLEISQILERFEFEEAACDPYNSVGRLASRAKSA
jgi:hypothetical protein